MDINIAQIRAKIHKVYGFKISVSDAIAYSIKHAGFVRTLSRNDILRLGELPETNTYNIKRNDYAILAKFHQETQHKDICTVEMLLTFIILTCSQSDLLYKPTLGLDITEPVKKQVKDGKISIASKKKTIDKYLWVDKY